MLSAEVRSDVLPPGTRLGGRYVVGKLLGDGGMAHVYRGEHDAIARRAVVDKWLAEHRAP